MGGSAAILVAGLGTGLVAYYGGGFPSLSASRVGTGGVELRAGRRRVVAYANVGEVMDSQLRQRLKERSCPTSRARRNSSAQTGIDIEHDIDYVVAAVDRRPIQLQPERPRRRPRPVQSHTARDPRPRARRRGRGIQGQAPGEGVRRCDAEAIPTGRHRRGSRTTAIIRWRSRSSSRASSPSAASGHQELDRRAAHRPQHHQQQRDDGARRPTSSAATTPGPSAASTPSPTRRKLPERDRQQDSRGQDVRGHDPHRRRRHRHAPRRGARRPSAENLRQVVQGFLALGRIQSRTIPKATALLNSLQLSGTGKTVALSFAIPSEMFDMIPKGPGAAGMSVGAAPRHRRSRRAAAAGQ